MVFQPHDSGSRSSDASGPHRVGRYELRGRLGSGAMGDVFLAWDPGAQREVALKTRRGGSAERFVREAELTAGLDHPGIVRVFDAGVDPSGLAYYACERVVGVQDLRDVFRTLPLAERVGLVRDAAAAVGHAHSRGVVHRDLKPDNLLVDEEGVIRVADFGLATAEDLERLTRTGALVGTPTHLAPEQWRALQGERVPIDPRSDVWALGVVLYEALTGELPFEGASWMELSARILAATPRAPSTISPEVPRALQNVCLRALSLDPAQRHPDGASLAAHLEEALLEQDSGGSGLKLALGMVVLATLGLGLAALYTSSLDPAPESSQGTVSPAKSPAWTQEPETSPSVETPPLEELTSLIERARAAGVAGRPQEGLDLLAEVMARAPRDPDALAARAKLLTQRGEREPALADLSAALEVAPERADLWAVRAELLRNLGRLDASLEDVKRALRLVPEHLAARYTQAWVIASRGQRDAAFLILDGQVAANPELAEAYCNRAELKSAAGNHPLALQDLAKALDLDPDSSRAYSLRVGIHVNRNELKAAREDIERGLSIAPGNLELRTNFGVVLMREGDLEGAIRELSRALEINPKLGTAYANRSYAYRNQGRSKEAIADLEQALKFVQPGTSVHKAMVDGLAGLRAAAELEGADFDVAKALAEVVRLRDQGRSDLALPLVKRVLAKEPESVRAIYLRGNLLMQLGRPREALAPLSRAVELDPNQREHHSDRGLAHQALGDQVSAIRDFDLVTKRWPNYALGWNNRAISRRKSGDAAGAVEDCDRALELRPNYVNALMNRANAHLGLGNLAKAEADCTGALGLQEHVSAYGLRGMIRQEAGNLAGARSDMKHFLAGVPANDPRRPRLEKRLAEVEAALAR